MFDQDPSAYQLYEAARDQVRHENEVVNHRLGWFLAIQGFLLAGFFGALELYQTFSSVPLAWVFLTLGLLAIGVLGILVSVITHRTLGWAYNQAYDAAVWWEKLEQDGVKLSTKFPRVGYLKPVARWRWLRRLSTKFPRIVKPKPDPKWPWLRTTTLPACFITVWILLLLLLIMTLAAAQYLGGHDATHNLFYSPISLLATPAL